MRCRHEQGAHKGRRQKGDEILNCDGCGGLDRRHDRCTRLTHAAQAIVAATIRFRHRAAAHRARYGQSRGREEQQD